MAETIEICAHCLDWQRCRQVFFIGPELGSCTINEPFFNMPVRVYLGGAKLMLCEECRGKALPDGSLEVSA